jgi:hypothetical protein
METVYYILSSPAGDSVWSRYGPLIVGFVLTTLIGGFFTWRLQSSLAARQTRLELFRKRYDEGTALLAAVSSLMDTRHYALQRFLWAIVEGKEDTVSAREKEYFEIVVRRSNSLRSLRNSIRLLVGEAEADDFLDYKDDDAAASPRSIHYKFVVSHRAVLASKSHPDQTEAAQDSVTEVNRSISRFLEELTTEFAQRANSLAILSLPAENRTSRRG